VTAIAGLAGSIVTSDGRRSWLAVADGRIAEIGEIGDDDPPPAATRLPDGWLVVPGYVDMHVHGGGGHDVTSGDPTAVIGAADFHRTHGTTTSLASMVTAPVDALVAAMRRIVALVESSDAADRRRLAGIHLEGPFLAVKRCGAQNPAHMVDPTPAAVDALIEAGGGHLRQITMAPERDGAIAAIERFVAAGVIVAVGHTDAKTADVAAAIAAGATVATHLGNAMPTLHHREPGPVGACLAAREVTCELIVDGHHLHPEFVRLVGTAKGADGVVLITDAISAAGSADGRYQLGGLAVDVIAGAARLASDDPAHPGSLAGSTLTMDAAVRNAVACGWSLEQAVQAAATHPARVLGLSDTGEIRAGAWADLVVLDDTLRVQAVIAAGEVVSGGLPSSIRVPNHP
jgi:N-acetylglucosamine-6-phosphate deacetylase